VEEASLCDKARSWKPLTATAKSQQEHVEDMIGIEVGEDYVEK
jgi:ppGpp synthetase/RelA/SpoT-type nucleotidyltranferase